MYVQYHFLICTYAKTTFVFQRIFIFFSLRKTVKRAIICRKIMLIILYGLTMHKENNKDASFTWSFGADFAAGRIPFAMQTASVRVRGLRSPKQS